MTLDLSALVESLSVPGRKTQIAGKVGASDAFVLARLFGTSQKPLVLLTSDLKEAKRWQNDLTFFLRNKGDVYLLPPLDVLPYFHLSPHPDVVMERLEVLWKISNSSVIPAKAGTHQPSNFILIVPVASLLRRLIPKQLFREKLLSVVTGDTLERDNLMRHLTSLSFERVPLVEDRGTFAVRGGILDIYPVTSSLAYRLEFFGDTVESIRSFNPQNQKSVETMDSVSLTPARELLLESLPKNWPSRLKKLADDRDFLKSERETIQEHLENKVFFNGCESFLPFFFENPSTLFDYLPDQSLLCFSNQIKVLSQIEEELEESRKHHKASTSLERLIKPEEIFVTRKEVEEWLPLFSQIDFGAGDATGGPPPSASSETESSDAVGGGEERQDPRLDIQSNSLIQQKIKARIASEQALEPLVTELNQKRNESTHIFLVASSPAQKERLKDLLTRYKLPLASPDSETEVQSRIEQAVEGRDPSPLIQIILGPLSEGFYWPADKQWWITDEEIFGKKGRRISKAGKRLAGEVFSSFAELNEGDYIIHLDHGVGVYRGLLNLSFGKTQNDFLLLEYLGGDKLYVPVDRLNRVARHTVAEGVHPMLDKMGGTSWQKIKAQVKTATRKLARQLLEIQAMRETQKGFAFSSQDTLFEEFEATFPFEETEDQLRAIEDVVKDMQRQKPMDRLICGDVGYGKTEVAIRAAFKAVEDHKQTAVLVPTTILAFQHYETFKKRFADYPINVEMLSRFRTATEQKKIVEGLANGAVDIIIATHRLLSKDIQMKDLGLLVIDEEHRFGVGQKEKIKKLKNLVDVLTLSATPIPRTLNFSLVGIRDLSLINTPPADRLAIRTFITYLDEGTIREAVMHEVKRGGQVYFVHNRVQSIHAMQERLKKMLPGITIEVGHGQMNEEELENVMIRFMEKKFDVLLCTTIIESGLDIPSANTIIINRADHMGLAQLYQLRGRVGRSHHRAYCYLITPETDLVTDVAKKRLQVIQKFTELGSGFKIASHDLEIRGAGNILGSEQSGHIAAIGYDLYVSLLKQAVDELKGKYVEEEIDPELKLDVSANIPIEMAPDTTLRLMLYKQASSLEKEEEVEDLREEWIDRFGPLSGSVENLLGLIRIKLRAKKLRITSVSFKNGLFTFGFHPTSPISTEYFVNRAKREPRKTQILPEGKFVIRESSTSEKETLTQALRHLEEFEKVVVMPE